ncbi:hypothetical protein [Streptomyces sp. WAC06614]|uniref:hypothetical protein n=1 Tax=Streptomyces sp. WAC06614 TaxID=2487416 RepID=UPI000F77B54A|nr:hypothetical protein [Streptomyces sp. WAC06614]RSS72229.1 hypothetical protein EF918_26800 [Streptomyces sp. WAC06614]
MAEHEEPDPSGGRPPLDEEAAWAAIVAGYGEEPPDPPGARPFKPIEDLLLPEEDVQPEPPAAAKDAGTATGTGDGTGGGAGKDAEKDQDVPPPALGSSVTFAPGLGGAGLGGPGPRDHSLAEPSDEDLDAADEGHFVPPDPPLPEADTTAKFAWLAVVGGPVLLLVAVLLQWEMTWWLTTLGIGGFLGGFATLVARMAQSDDEDDDPGRGAVV